VLYVPVADSTLISAYTPAGCRDVACNVSTVYALSVGNTFIVAFLIGNTKLRIVFDKKNATGEKDFERVKLG
jgi:hypothetical protein